MGEPRPLAGHSVEWQGAYLTAAPEDRAQNQLVSQLALPIGASQTREQAQRVAALRTLFSTLDPSTAYRLYDRLDSSDDSLGRLFHLTLHHATRASLMSLLNTIRHAPDRGIGPTSRGTNDPKVVPPLPKSVTDTGPISKAPRPKPKPVIPPSPPRPWPWPPNRPQMPNVLPPPTHGPGVIDWLSDQLTRSSRAAGMIAGLMLILPREAVAAAVAAAAAVFGEGGTFARAGKMAAKEIFARAGEMAAKEMLKWTLNHTGLPWGLYDVYEISKNFPGIDLMSSIRPLQVKTFGIDAKVTKFEVAMRIANEMERLYGGKLPWDDQPIKTAKALLKWSALIKQHGAWPIRWPPNPTIEQLQVLIRDTAFGVPDDLVIQVRGAFGKKLANPKFRELFPELRLGSLVDPRTLSRAEEERWAGRVTNFLLTRVVGVGVTTDQVRAMAAAAQQLSTP